MRIEVQIVVSSSPRLPNLMFLLQEKDTKPGFRQCVCRSQPRSPSSNYDDVLEGCVFRHGRQQSNSCQGQEGVRRKLDEEERKCQLWIGDLPDK